MTNDQFIKGQLAALVHREAHHHGGIDNMLAVAFVLRNRQRAGWLGGSWMQLIQQADNYTGTLYPVAAVDLRDQAFRIVLAQIDDIYSGLAADRYTEGALYYAELNKIDRAWFRENVLQNLASHARAATVGNVTFFR